MGSEEAHDAADRIEYLVTLVTVAEFVVGVMIGSIITYLILLLPPGQLCV